MPARVRRDHSHVDWGAIRDLCKNGVTLREISKLFEIPYRTLACRSHREGWNVMALRNGLNLPKRTSKEHKALRTHALQIRDNLPEIATEIRSNFASALLKLSRFYRDSDVSLLRKDSRQILQNVYAASKLLGFNDGKSVESTPTINLTVLGARPAELVACQAREVSVTIPDSQSGVVATQVVGNQEAARDPVSNPPDSGKTELG